MHKLFALAVVPILLLLCLSVTIQATANTPPNTIQSISTDDYTTIVANLNISSLPEQENSRKILCFDVNEDGYFVLGFDSLPRKVCVFDNNGIFQYGFSFSEYGTYGVTLTNTGVIIHLVRSGMCVEINPDADVITITKIPPILENNRYWQEVSSQAPKKINEKTYMIKNNHEFICIDSDANEKTLFETESTINLPLLIFVIILAVFFGILSYLRNRLR